MSAFFEVELEAEGAADAELLAVVDFLAGVFAFPVFFIFFAGFWLVQKQLQSLQRASSSPQFNSLKIRKTGSFQIKSDFCRFSQNRFQLILRHTDTVATSTSHCLQNHRTSAKRNLILIRDRSRNIIHKLPYSHLKGFY